MKPDDDASLLTTPPVLTACSRTDRGTVRLVNEDALLCRADIPIFAVADGMGGHNAGEVAATIALDTIRAFVRKSSDTDDFTWPFGFNTSLTFGANQLITALKLANRRVFRASEERIAWTGMGTTVVAALVEGTSLLFTSVGDSRVYSFLGAQLARLTDDDSWIFVLRQSGADERTVGEHPMRNVLTKVVGATPEIDVTVQEVTLVDGQIILLCSDGLHGALSDESIVSILKNEPDLECTADRLIEAAIRSDGRDNVTVVLARYNRSRERCAATGA